jgi:hypothetical protein
MADLADLPPGFQLLLEKIGEQPPEVRHLFRHPLVLAMNDDEKAPEIGTRVEERE